MSDEKTNEHIPSSFKLRYTLRGNSSRIKRVGWSPDGCILASPARGKTIHLWDMQTGKTLRVLTGHMGAVYSVAWSPDGTLLASGSNDQSIRIWEVQSGNNLRTIRSHVDRVTSVAWSPDGQLLASGSFDKTICLWNIRTGERLRTLTGHSSSITWVAWSPDGQLLASSSGDQTVKLWNAHTGQELVKLTGHTRSVRHVAWSPNGELLASCSSDKTIRLWKMNTTGLPLEMSILEGHTGQISCVSFSHDNHFLASKSDDGTVRLWRISTLETSSVLDEATVNNASAGLAFHPTTSILATLGEDDQVVRIWDLDLTTLLTSTPITPSVHYTNAKVVLVGDSGVGKSGLGLVLIGQPFVPTESTHGRSVWLLNTENTDLEDGRKEIREILLWDLAGQPGYRLIHQLHLSEVGVALVVFDARSETDPFAGIQYWDRALRQAQVAQGHLTPPLKKFLVAARTDRGGIGVSSERIQSLMQKLCFDGYFETSAKEGMQIEALKNAILKVIDWERLPKISSTLLFQDIKAFLVSEKEAGRVLSTTDDLYRLFLILKKAPIETKDLPSQFAACLGRVESAGLIQRLSFGNVVLLQPELLDIYASALINTVKDEPDGLGSITEERVHSGDFRLANDKRLEDRGKENLLLIEMVEDLLRHELVLREGPFLIFPSQSTRENADLPDPESKSVIFEFEGPVTNIYAMLAVRLSHSGFFKKKELWKNAVTYTAIVGGTCGMILRNIDEGRGELTLFFDKATSNETRLNFEEYIFLYLQRRVPHYGLRRRRMVICRECGWIVTDQTVQLLMERGTTILKCLVCGERILLLDVEEHYGVLPSRSVLDMDQMADRQRDQEVAKSIIRGKKETKDFDVFLCYNDVDRQAVKQIGKHLKDRGYLPWLDEWELPPGRPWQRLLEKQIRQIKSAAVFVGNGGIGPWQQLEIEAFLREFVRRDCPVIPVLLADSPKKPKLPLYLKVMTWVDFRRRDPDPMEQLIWGITGQRVPFD